MSCPEIVDNLNALALARGWTFTCSQAICFDAPGLNVVNDLWQAHAASDRIPARNDFSARTLKDFLPDLMIADVVPSEGGHRFRYRLVGTRAERYLGEMTGSFLDEYLPAAVYERTAACYRAIVETRCPLRFLTQFSLDKIDFLTAEFFGAPLSQDGTTPDMVMTVTDFRVRS